MSSRGAVLLGQQFPRLVSAPASDWSHAEDAAFLASSYGLAPDEWQFTVLEAWLGARRNGRWSSTTCGLAVARQNGKNGLLEIRELYGMVALGEKFLHTAHEVKTARKAFLRLKSFFENDRQYPELAALASEIRRTNGQEAIVLHNGGSVEFVARSKGSGRGFTVDILVLDEAQELSDEALAALKPTISAAPLQNPQTILTGTPPAPTMNGEVFTRTRSQAKAKTSARLAWHEWSLEGSVDLDDKANWAATNPSLGTRLNIEVLEDERTTFSDEDFARERLGMWDEDEQADDEDALDVAAWEAGTDPDSRAPLVAFGIEADLGRAWASIGGAGAREDGRVHVEAERRRGVRWLLDEAVRLDDRHDHPTWVVDGRGPIRDVIPDLEERGLRVVTASTEDVALAYVAFTDALAAGEVAHGPDEVLLSAMRSARRRPCGDAGYTFGLRRSGSDISAVKAVGLALWAAQLEAVGPSLW